LLVRSTPAFGDISSTLQLECQGFWLNAATGNRQMTRRLRPALKRLDHTTIVVADLSATRTFYTELLGMTEVRRPDFDFAGAWFAINPAQRHADLHATVTSEQAGRPGWGELGATRLSRGHHFAFQVDDAVSFEKFLKEHDVEIAVPCRPRPDGPIQFYVRDPDGHVIELFSMEDPEQVR
jgi:catechol 2,3-dioxygenase-like lactoylglutathione lyase family enzyme